MSRGIISKMRIDYDTPVQYTFVVSDNLIPLNAYLNRTICLKWTGKVQCFCGKTLSEFYRQNFCYQCFWNAPQASPSIFKPELCTADLGIEERDFAWEQEFQIAPHYIYLANSSGLKVGITRKTQKITRWMDQGASQAILLAQVPNRRLSGLIEVELKKILSDKTQWRKMLSGVPMALDLKKEKAKYLSIIPKDLHQYIIDDNSVTEISYPVIRYPFKIPNKNSLSFQKDSVVEGKLMGIKGQYLMLDNDRVFNVRKHEGYIIDCLF